MGIMYMINAYSLLYRMIGHFRRFFGDFFLKSYDLGSQTHSEYRICLKDNVISEKE